MYTYTLLNKCYNKIGLDLTLNGFLEAFYSKFGDSVNFPFRYFFPK